MPSTSKNQQIAAAIALKAKKEGKKPKAGTASAQMVKMSQEDLEKFAKTKHKGLPKKKGKKNEAFGQKLDTYLEIIWRWFERQGYAEHEIDAILNDSENMEVIQSAEAHGINPILVAKDLKTTEIEALSENYEESPEDEDPISRIFFSEYLPNKGFFDSKITGDIDIDPNRDPNAEEKIINDFSKYLEEEYYDIWNPALEKSLYKEIVQKFLTGVTNESVNEEERPKIKSYSPITLDEFLNESKED